MPQPWVTVSDEVRAALAGAVPVVALESTLVAHGLPRPANLETAREAEAAVRAAGAVPATVAVWHGVPTVGLTAAQLKELAAADGVMKASRRDLGAAVGLGRLAATTVSATMALAHAAGVRVFATGGIGGAHRAELGMRNSELGIENESRSAFRIPHSAFRITGEPFDISADLTELARTPVLVVCAGAKSILHLPRTLEILETLGVPVLGFRTGEFPAFYVLAVPDRQGGGDSATAPICGANPDREGGGDCNRNPLPHGRGSPDPLPVSARVESPTEAAAVFAAHVRMGGGGAVLAQPCPADVAVPADEFAEWLAIAEVEARAAGVGGAKLTPFLLGRLASISGGRTLAANRALIVNNARLAAEVAVALTGW